MQPLFLKPIFQERIWGGTALRDIFGYSIPSHQTGECWAISAHPVGASIITNGQYAGMTLHELWKNHRGLFNHDEGETFPLLTKILDAKEALSVQVHPDDAYAMDREGGSLGKTECWYILDCKEDAEIILGHRAKTRTELVEMIEKKQWNQFLRRVKVKPGDFFYVPSGTLHALGAGILVLETQQSSDTTYRVYDYDRKDDKGASRTLHLDKALEVITVPHIDYHTAPAVEKRKGITITTLVKAKYFSVYHWEVAGKASLEREGSFLLCSVIKGQGRLQHQESTYELAIGQHFILPSTIDQFSIEGKCTLIVSHP
ncbi:mannose-6-phosphate isomerase, class I [Alkaliphilus crotonatoxidans]